MRRHDDWGEVLTLRLKTRLATVTGWGTLPLKNAFWSYRAGKGQKVGDVSCQIRADDRTERKEQTDFNEVSVTSVHLCALITHSEHRVQILLWQRVMVKHHCSHHHRHHDHCLFNPVDHQLSAFRVWVLCCKCRFKYFLTSSYLMTIYSSLCFIVWKNEVFFLLLKSSLLLRHDKAVEKFTLSH